MLFDVDEYDYIPQEEDRLVLNLKKVPTAQEISLSKPASGLEFEFRPEDTQDLECGSYTYDVRLTTGDGRVFTIAGPSVFYLVRDIQDENA